ncbi:acyl-CoA dehydrogenase [Rhodococcus sp. WMMA185]|uniref:acyl-CoA dehydrogenase family protein n=1 Tax=Rhodococcus sp. WMMA185 TaxID=679318 RepID=UPI000878FBCC|nr:acyl-CoA dehydrogenase family protein [Rhodococcus sp. WMMA185]AOW93042.1 acyl-CoA dehydrogenase [Rhodococcus sp. WMMA185]
MSTADLLYSDTEDALRDSVRRLLADRCPPESVAAMYDQAPADFTAVWKALAVDLGLAGLLVPETLGGAGASAREAAVVMEEIGRAAAPVPYLSSAVLATVALLKAGDEQTVGALADGTTTGALAVGLATAPGRFAPSVRLDAGTLVGTVTSVAGASAADVLIVPVEGSEGLELHVVSAGAAGVTVAPVLSLDMTRPLSDVTFDGVASTRVDEGTAAEAVRSALGTGAALLASEQLGIAKWCFETTLAYVKERKQFGRAVGSFQAIKHRIADLWLEVTSATAAARYAADTSARGDSDAEIAAALAQAYCSDVAVHAAEECIQLHAGIGMTWEYPAHLYLKRAKSDQLAFGTPYRHRAHLATLIDLPA